MWAFIAYKPRFKVIINIIMIDIIGIYVTFTPGFIASPLLSFSTRLGPGTLQQIIQARHTGETKRASSPTYAAAGVRWS